MQISVKLLPLQHSLSIFDNRHFNASIKGTYNPNWAYVEVNWFKVSVLDSMNTILLKKTIYKQHAIFDNTIAKF